MNCDTLPNVTNTDNTDICHKLAALSAKLTHTRTHAKTEIPWEGTSTLPGKATKHSKWQCSLDKQLVDIDGEILTWKDDKRQQNLKSRANVT